MLTAARIIDRANQIAKGRGFEEQGLDGLNAILSDLCEDHDLALARGLFEFTFNPSLSTLYGSGPYPLPLDYLRTSGSSGATGATRSAWFMYPTETGAQPMPLIPVDLAQFDQYPQYPSQGLPSTWATDMGGPLTQRIVLATTAALTSGSASATVALATNLAIGRAVAGEGIEPGTTIEGISGLALTLSAAATATIAAASVFFGIAPVGYAYPPPVGAYPVSIRYQRKMPPITDTAQIPWFPNEGYLIDKLAAMQMPITGDGRRMEFEETARVKLGRYLDLADDKTNRAQSIQLDQRQFGRGGGRGLPITKNAGW